MTRVRVFSDFPVTYETPFAENVFLDERSGPLRISFDQLSGKLNSYAGSPSKSLAEIVTCPMHRLGGWKNAGKVAIARSYYLAYQLPNMVQSCYVCRLHKEAGYFFFGELADVLCINPVQESWHFNRTQKFGENVVQWLTELARLAAAPRSVYTVIVAQNSPIFTDRVATPDEERLMVAYALAGGTKGIIYRARGRGGKTPQQIALAQEVRNINAELHAIKRFIKIGEPMHIAFASDPFVASNAILCGDHAVLLILINRNVWGFGHKWKEYFGWEPRKKFQVHVQLPPRMKITDAFEPATQERPIGFRTEANGVVTVDVPDINLVRTIVLTVDPKDREFDQDGDGLPDLKEVILGTNPAKPGF